jgi:hypothetical protein
MAKKAGVIEIQGKDYELVASRVSKFRSEHPDWTIHTELISNEDKVLFKCTILNGEQLISTGHAEETPGTTHINKTSALENCETSAVGRALSLAGYAGNYNPTKEEVEAAEANALKLLQGISEDQIKKLKTEWLKAFPDDAKYEEVEKYFFKRIEDFTQADYENCLARIKMRVKQILDPVKIKRNRPKPQKGPKKVD